MLIRIKLNGIRIISTNNPINYTTSMTPTWNTLEIMYQSSVAMLKNNKLYAKHDTKLERSRNHLPSLCSRGNYLFPCLAKEVCNRRPSFVPFRLYCICSGGYIFLYRVFNVSCFFR